MIRTVTSSLILGILVMNSSADAQDAAQVEASPKSFVSSLGMKMIFVKGASFDAWTPSLGKRNAAHASGEQSDHMFALNRPRVPLPATVDDYYMAQFPVTNGVYRRFVADTGHRPPHGRLMDFYWSSREGSPWDMPDFSGDDLPVTGVNNEDMNAFCKWRSEKEGRRYRPTQLYEFEHANRAGTDTRYWWGERPDARYMNYGVSRIGHPTPVGSYPANPWGFYDTHGNVWQYCFDVSRYSAMGSAFNSSQRLTGADVFGNFNEGPNVLALLSCGFRIGCDADQGHARPGDLDKPTIVAAGGGSGGGPVFAKLKISVGERIDLGAIDRNAAVFFITADSTWILNTKRSTDRGKTWQPCTMLGEARVQLRDGTIVAIAGGDSGGGAAHFDHMTGRGNIKVLLSTDDWATVETIQAPVHLPLGRKYHPVRGLVEMKDGRLLATMYGYMDGDQIREESPVAAELRTPWVKTRVIVIESADGGRSWRYLSTLSYNPHLGTEGQNETDLIQLQSGQLFAAMRTGIHGEVDPHGREHLDQPLLVAWSADGGRTWSDPQRVHVDGKLITGIYPRILLTEEGVLGILRCRPDGSVILSPDGGGTFFSDEVTYFPAGDTTPPHAGMQDMVRVGPDTFLVVDVMRKGGGAWYAEGVPITVRKVAP